MTSSFNLTGKTALVTGCSKGIGKAMAIGLAEAGANIIGVSSSLELAGSEIEKEIMALGKNFKAYAADFSDRDALHLFIKKVIAENSVIDILINNAGTIMRAPAAEHSDEYWDKVQSINLDAPFILAREIGKNDCARQRKNNFHLFSFKFSRWCKRSWLCSQQRCFSKFN